MANLIGHFENLPLLEQMDRSPITVPPETPLMDAISLIGQARESHHEPSPANLAIHSNLKNQSSSSSVLVMDRSQLVGIFTERDVVKLLASKVTLSKLRIAEVMTQPVIRPLA